MEPTQVAKFIGDLANSASDATAFDDREAEKRRLLAKMNEDLAAKKEEIRSALSFQVVDAKGKRREHSIDDRGSEYAVDTFGSTSRGRGISEDDWPKVQQAMIDVVEVTEQATSATDASGGPLFTAQEITQEIFTPLVREGLLPETFVMDDYSEVQQLLNASYESYKETVEAARQAKLDAKAQLRMDLSNGQVLDFLKNAEGLADELQETINENDPALLRRLDVVVKGFGALGGVGNAFFQVGRALPDADGESKAVTSAEKFLNPVKYRDNLDDTGTRLPSEPADWPEDLWGEATDEASLDLRVEKFSKTFGPQLGTLMASHEAGYVTDSVKYAFGDVLNKIVGGMIVSIDELSKLDEKIKAATLQARKREAAEWAVDEIDEAMEAELSPAMSGLYASKVDLQAVKDAASPDTNGDALVKLLAAGFRATLEAASPASIEPIWPLFSQAGQDMAAAFTQKAGGKTLDKALKSDSKQDPFEAFAPIVDAARRAVAETVSDDLRAAFQQADTQNHVLQAATWGDEEQVLDRLERSEEEIREYERMLVLIDEGRISAAEQKSIEHLILKMKQDRKTLSLVKTIGSAILGAHGFATGIAARASDGLNQVGASLIAPVKAANLILKLSTEIIQAAERYRIYRAFQEDFKRAKAAASSLTPAIQGFMNNKEEQVTFADVQIALDLVQTCFSIVGTVPTPITIAIGKTASAVTSAVQKFTEFQMSLYNEVQLTEAWKVTLSALNNPRDRQAGSKALRLNPTLGMHAVAWAAITKQPPDPIARMLLNTLGLDEQSLAVSGSEGKVREYLETVLHEDRDMTDSNMIKTDWAPEKFELSAKDWFVVTRRAAKQAVPKLALGDEREVFEKLKLLDDHNVEQLAADGENGSVDPGDFVKCVGEAQQVCDALRSYTPRASDKSTHQEMWNVAAGFMKLADEHRRVLEELQARNADNRVAQEEPVAV